MNSKKRKSIVPEAVSEHMQNNNTDIDVLAVNLETIKACTELELVRQDINRLEEKKEALKARILELQRQKNVYDLARSGRLVVYLFRSKDIGEVPGYKRIYFNVGGNFILNYTPECSLSLLDDSIKTRWVSSKPDIPIDKGIVLGLLKKQKYINPIDWETELQMTSVDTPIYYVKLMLYIRTDILEIKKALTEH